MNKIDELLMNEKVEWKKLGDIGDFYGGITGKSKQDFNNGNAKFITYKNVYLNTATNINIKDKVKIKSEEKQRKLMYGDILFTGSSETLDECGIASVITSKFTEDIYLNSFCFFLRLNNTELLLPDFSKYLFRSEKLRLKIIKTASGVTRFNVSKELMKKIEIPIPPIEIQKKVVQILDKFQLLLSDTKGLLPQEIEQRQKQYEYYREKLLTFGVECGNTHTILISRAYFDLLKEAADVVGVNLCGVSNKNLGEICEILDSKRKPITKSQRISGEYPYYGANGIQDYVEGYIFDGTYILMGEDGSVINKDGTPVLHWVNNKKIWVNNHAHILGVSNIKTYNLRYIYYYLSNYNVSEIVKGVPPKINQANMKKIRILVPPIQVQEYVVSVLDKFETLINDISTGIPKEIELRQKQYEYYREKLLNFKR